MEKTASKQLLFCLLFILSAICITGLTDFVHKEPRKAYEQTPHLYRKELIGKIQHDDFMTTFPTTSVTTPNPATVIAPPDITTPQIVTDPPATATPNSATLPPLTDPPNPPTPVTNPVTTPSTTIPGGQPVVAPPVVGNTPTAPGQSWCVARGGLPETAAQVALNYVCGVGGADCSAIQQGGSCYNPNTLQNHASYAFNSYYQRNPVQTNCDFGGAATITNVNPSSGSCVFTTSSSSSASPTMASPITPTPIPVTDSSTGATPSGTGTPPNILSASNPGIGGYGEGPPAGSTSLASLSSSLQPFICCIAVVISVISGKIVLDM